MSPSPPQEPPIPPDDGRTVERHLRAAVESSPSGLLMVDQEGRIILVNREIERLFGYDREELIGESIEILVPERFRDRHPGFREGFYGAPDTRSMGAGRDLYGLRKDGSEIPVEIGLNPIETDEGLLVLSSIVDISARQREEAERKQLEAQLRQAQKLEAVGTLAGGIAHDFNNILGALLGFAELLEDRVQDPQGRKDLEEQKKLVMRGKDLVSRIQAFSRRQEANRIPFSLGGPLEEVTELLRSSVDPGIEIVSRVDPHTPRILGDPSAMHQVLVNLGMNAVHAMPSGGRLSMEVDSVYVTDSKARKLQVLSEGHHAVLSVRDTGTGILEDLRERVFEPFFTTKEPGIGSGLGLAIVHGIVSEHRGALELESEVGKGTTVRVYLPAVDLAEPETEPEGEVPQGHGEHVLYVDDEPGLREVGKRRLEGIGYEVTVAQDGQAALETLRAAPEQFDAIVTDHLMPRMTGLQLARAAAEIRPDLPIVLLTGYLPAAEIEASGVEEVISKPVTLLELASRLRALFERPPSEPPTDA